MAHVRRTHKSASGEEETRRPSSSVNTTMALPLFSRTYLPRSRPGSAVRERRPTSVSPRKARVGSRTSRLRSRLIKSKDAPIAPEVAAQVIKDYLIPLFEADSRTAHDKRRSLTFGTAELRFNEEPSYSNESSTHAATKKLVSASTLYEELKLSEQLRDELNSVREQKKEMEGRAKEAEQQRESLSSEVKHVMLLHTKSTADLKLIQASYSASQRSFQAQESTLVSVRSQLEETQKLHSEAEQKVNKLSMQLHEEKAKNDKLKNKAWELMHTNDLLRLENSIMGEQLKGLYQAICHISGSHFLEIAIGSEVTHMSQSMFSVLTLASQLEHDLTQLTVERDELRCDLTEAVSLRNEMRIDRGRIYKLANEKMNILQVRLQMTEEERDRLRIDEQKYEKRFKDLTDEYEKLRTRMNQYRLKRKQYGEVEEKMCRLCQRVFTEAENYNWSCRTHSGEYGGEMWWCCGKTGRDASGCKSCKHESKDEESTMLAKDKEDIEQLRLVSAQCPVNLTQSCKEFGHRPSDCPKDPNLRSKFDLNKEMDRVETIFKYKKTGISNGISPSQALSLLGQKSKIKEFHNLTVATSPISSILDSMDEEEADKDMENEEYFEDIKKLMRKVEHNPEMNLMQVDTLSPKASNFRSVIAIEPLSESI